MKKGMRVGGRVPGKGIQDTSGCLEADSIMVKTQVQQGAGGSCL
jgi:hypothetical protein